MTDEVILSISVERALHETLSQLAQETGRSVEDLVREAITAAITPAMQLDLEAICTAILADLQSRHSHWEIGVHITEEQVARMKKLLPQSDRARLMLGDELIHRLTGICAQVPPTANERVRLEGVAIVCDLLLSNLSEDRVRHWWIKPRYKLHGKAPVDFLGQGWRPDELAFRMVVEIAEGDAGFVAV